ncbi:MAG: type IV toxin-antitoxin system AbiEi family antitoxin [Solirubrobacteraceae bacterium]
MDKVRLARLAERQFGRVRRGQLQEIGLSNATVAAWREDGYLHRVLPHVYAVGSRAQTTESDLAAALLYAGPGAALSHATAAWWLGLIEKRPYRTQVTTPRKCRSLRGIRVYDRRHRTRINHNRLPTTSVPQTLLDLAATAPLHTLRRALANAEYQEVLNLEAVEQALSRGCRGAAKLRKALERHQPSLALTKSWLERMLIGICERERIPLPEINVDVDGWQVDALWRDAKLAVELDGYGNHHTPAQLRRDRRKEMALRKAGLTPVRYSADQLKERTEVAAELRPATIL